MSALPTILAIETSTPACSASLLHNGETHSLSELGNNIHSQVLLNMVQGLFKQAGVTAKQLDAVAVGQGPGSFTGLRIGVGVAQGIAYGAACGMLGVSSLDALAQQAEFNGAVVAGIDARMGEIYWAEYIKSVDGVERISQLNVSSPSGITVQQKDCQWTGNAWAEYHDKLTPELAVKLPSDQRLYPQASSLLALAQGAFARGEMISPIDFAPEYVRNNVATKPLRK